MKKLFFFDVETTGAIASSDAIIQMGAIFGSLDEATKEFHVERVISQYINTDTKISRGAYMVHGIKKETIAKFGYMNEYIFEFMNYIKKADMIIGHNVSFDIGMLLSEARRQGLEISIPEHKKFCTMKESTHICKLPHKTRSGYKRPKLGELHQFVFDREFEKAHDALADIQATKDCFLELYRRGEIDPFNKLIDIGEL